MLAHALLCDGQYDAALAEIEVALRDNPELADGQLIKGLTLSRQGRLEEAVRPLQLALESKEFPRAAAFSLIVNYLKLEHFDRAAQIARDYTRENDRDAQAHALHAEALSRSGKTDEAQVIFRRSAELDPSLAPVRMRLGELLSEAGQLDAAMAELVAAVRLAPMNVRALEALAGVLRRQGRFDQAIAVYRRAMSTGQPTASLLLGMAECYYEQNMVPAALSTVRGAMMIDSQLPGCHRLMGKIYSAQGRPIEARQFEAAADRLCGTDAAETLPSATPSALTAPSGK
jgi:superkiller protein 3